MPNPKNFKNFDKWISWMSVLVTAVSALWVVKHYEVVEVWIHNAGFFGPVVSVGIYALLSLTPIPSDPLTLLNGVLFGWSKGLFISWMGNNAAAMVEYFVFRNIRDLTNFDQHHSKLPVWLTRWPADSAWFLIIGRFLPGFGGKIVSIMAGMYKVSWWKYIWTTAVANLVGSFIYFFGGWGFIYSLRHFIDWLDRLKEVF